MRSIAIMVFISGLLISCNSPQQANQTKKANIEKEAVSEDMDTEMVYSEIKSNEALIATALMAAPEESREGCKVMGYNMEGEFVTFREGDNEFICLADDPRQDGFSAACYHHSLEPFMVRGRELKAQGMSHSEIFEIREKEAKAGTLQLGKPGATLHVYYSAEAKYNEETSEVANAKHRYVVYMPWATAESTGLPEQPHAENHPWIMNPGTHRAHIMITPK